MITALTYDNILLLPQYSELESRSLADTKVDFLGRVFKLPIMPANMVDVIDDRLAKFFSESYHFYVMHRGEGSNVVEFVRTANSEAWKTISISVGVNEDSYKQLTQINKEHLIVDFITIDVAHGDHIKVRRMIEWLRETFTDVKIIAGNVATEESALHLEEWGASAIKAGIGGGRICSTRYQTGFHVPMYTCIKNICKSGLKLPVIADGGIKHLGDISKAIHAGATMVMAGGLFAECVDSPAQIINGKKQYNGSTSFAVKKENKHVEGISLTMDAGVTVEERLKEIKMALQSSISYAGGTTINSLLHCGHILV